MALTGRLAFVTGAGSGIGRATCLKLAQEGASVIAADKNVQNVEETLNLLPLNSKEKHLSLTLSVEKSEELKQALEKIIKQYARPPSIVVNSAGITRDNFLIKLSEEDFDEVLNVNLKGTFLVTQTFTKAMIQHEIQNGSIVNIGSIIGKYGNIGQANYSASKAGVEMLSITASKELGKFGIRVNAVLPGMIDTPMAQAVPGKVKEKFLSMIPLARFGKPEEVAEVIAFLASSKSSYVNGASITVTGGF